MSYGTTQLQPLERFWRNRVFARIRHHGARLHRASGLMTRGHAGLIRLSGGRIRRSYAFTGGMPMLVLTTVGRKSGKRRSTPLAYLRHGTAFAVMASNAGSDRTPGWWHNLQADPSAEIFAERTRHTVTARPADPAEDEALWNEAASLNPGFDEYRSLTERRIPIVVLEPATDQRQRSSE